MAFLDKTSTADVASADALAYWSAIASNMIAPLDVEPLGEGPFRASLASRRLRECAIMSPCSSPARVFREGECEAGVLNLQLQHRGRTVNHTGGRTATLEEGDFLLYDPSRPLWLTFSQPTQSIVLRLSRAMVEQRLPNLRGQVGVAVNGRSGPGALFANFLRRAWREFEGDNAEGCHDWAESFGEVLWPLLHIAYSGRPGFADNSAETNRRDERRRALFAAVEADLTDPGLDVHRLARRMGVSARYVQMLFADLGTTPRAYIQDRRLDMAARRLEREGHGTTVTDVAHDVGFSDLSSFCRAFRRRFATSPRNYGARDQR